MDCNLVYKSSRILQVVHMPDYVLLLRFFNIRYTGRSFLIFWFYNTATVWYVIIGLMHFSLSFAFLRSLLPKYYAGGAV